MKPKAQTVLPRLTIGDLLAMKWIDVNERLPAAHQCVLVACPGTDDPVWIGYLDGESWRYMDGLLASGVTHWMELPEPPTERKT